ncbi:hypothetical protein [Brasilonema sp. UFV-L1]|uniref:hypothetical protein n=1 Tax=Brasilonema sp. UFV-L1 TaxID=2234130 RepID=UPI0030D6E26F
MSSISAYLEQNHQNTQRLVGLKYEQLEQLIKQALALHNERLADMEARKVRIINKGGGRRVKLSIEEQILLTLIYLRHLTHLSPPKLASPISGFTVLPTSY